MASQVGNGKSFEWAIARVLADSLEVPITEDNSALTAKVKFQEAPAPLKRRHMIAASVAIEHILTKEGHRIARGVPQSIRIASDRAGQLGDVRDVVVQGTGDLLGISCKNNHRAFKHSRLSSTIDFIGKWGLSESGASETYQREIAPIFDRLQQLRDQSQGTMEWKNLSNKQNEIYAPILSAFEKELQRVTALHSNVETQMCRAFINYIVGNNDFYKVICRKGMVEILGFNFHGTLNVKRSRYPTQIHSVERDTKKKSTSVVRFQEGHTFAFRVHNAATLIEPSLKFDIQALSLPSSEIYTNHLSLTDT